MTLGAEGVVILLHGLFCDACFLTLDSASPGGVHSLKRQQSDAAALAAKSEFVGSISQCFEKHLQVYVDLEEKTLMGHVDDLIKAETWLAEENVLTSSTQARRDGQFLE